MKKLFTLLTLALVTSISACNTVRGVGEDVEKLGENIQGN